MRDCFLPPLEPSSETLLGKNTRLGGALILQTRPDMARHDETTPFRKCAQLHSANTTLVKQGRRATAKHDPSRGKQLTSENCQFQGRLGANPMRANARAGVNL